MFFTVANHLLLVQLCYLQYIIQIVSKPSMHIPILANSDKNDNTIIVSVKQEFWNKNHLFRPGVSWTICWIFYNKELVCMPILFFKVLVSFHLEYHLECLFVDIFCEFGTVRLMRKKKKLKYITSLLMHVLYFIQDINMIQVMIIRLSCSW